MSRIITITQLPVDTLIQVRVRAHNSKGWGDYSELNTLGATIETLPGTMTAPTFDLSLSSNTQIYLQWTSLTGQAAGGQYVSVSS